MTEPFTQGTTAEVVNDSSENIDFIIANTVPGNEPYAGVLCQATQKTVLPIKWLFGGMVSWIVPSKK